MADPKGFVATQYDPLTYKIIGCAMALHRKLGSGLREDSYQRGLEAEFADAGLQFTAQPLFSVYDDTEHEKLIGYYIPDFIVEGKVVVEIKALSGMDKSHEAQIIGYLAVTSCPVGLLLNFGNRSLEKKRIFPPKNIADHQVNRQWLFVPDMMK